MPYATATMTYDEALKEARKWAEGVQISSYAAKNSLTYFYFIQRDSSASSCRQRANLRCILDNLQGWKGSTARAAKEAIKAQVRKLGGTI